MTNTSAAAGAPSAPASEATQPRPRRRQRVAVVGAGASGLTAVKACLEEGLDVVCYERTDVLGGLWRYTDTVERGRACVMRSTVINSSKELSAFSDFPPDARLPNYMHNTLMARYIEDYGRHCGAVDKVLLRHEVAEVKPSTPDCGRWTLRVRRLDAGDEFVEEWDAVMVCTGHHAQPLWPRFKGLGDERGEGRVFSGRVMHAQDYRKPRGFEDRKVLVVGVGNSAGDLAVELGGVAEQVWLSTRRGSWVIGRVGPRGRPFDATYTTRMLNLVVHLLPYSVVCLICESAINQRFDHAAYRLKPKHRILGQHPMVNDALPNRILSGTVLIKGNVKEFTKDGVLFEDDPAGAEPLHVDDVILATGYRVSFPYLAPGVLDMSEDNHVGVYRLVFPPDKPGLALIGLAQPIGALLPISEMQSRWAARVFAGEATLPSPEDMWRQVNEYQEGVRRRYYQEPRHTLQVDWIDYMDELADQIGVKPNLARLALMDPQLALRLLVGPSLPYQYRLQGPHAWPRAREAIFSYEERVRRALSTGPDFTASSDGKGALLTKPSVEGLLLITIAVLFFSWLLASGWFFPQSWTPPLSV
ncbi:flavin-containing monooxygenase 5-like isoform X2 [Amblyomma americanum]